MPVGLFMRNTVCFLFVFHLVDEYAVMYRGSGLEYEYLPCSHSKIKIVGTWKGTIQRTVLIVTECIVHVG